MGPGGPERTAPPLAHLPMTALRAHRDRLRAEEAALSAWRQIIAGSLEPIPLPATPDTIAAQQVIISTARTAPVPEGPPLRWPLAGNHLPGVGAYGLPELPPCAGVPDRAELTGQWRALSTCCASRRAEVVESLRCSERALSRHRDDVHLELDAATDELVGRLTAQPAARLDALREQLLSAT